MTKEVENLSEIKKCVQCGYCCMQKPCQYGYKKSIINRRCACLVVDNKEKGTHICGIYKRIQHLEKDFKFPMFGSGCFSTLFNDHRHLVLQKIRKMAVERITRPEEDSHSASYSCSDSPSESPSPSPSEEPPK